MRHKINRLAAHRDASPSTDGPSSRELERQISRLLSELPLARAPRRLGSEVLRRVDHGPARAAPQGLFESWPMPSRATFVLLALASAASVFAAEPWLAAHVVLCLEGRPAVASLGAWFEQARWLLARIGALPRDWLYAALLTAVAPSALMLGLTVSVRRAFTSAAAHVMRGS